ncbi:MAG: hypothetical protein A3G49_06550 [Candidatus Sungbacteria bacterium RIFCSPLOWO2_12_FULL_41_11]|uniref:Uncharacterized protein n=1 Tax=Candidatus Sungbacteria bacterium RIFCSPLOWO2_12_FULL_41_11 TaxID=1802286 RepID=A0A1G2LS52_9BACT|nr:MAG: hypothetical protein UV01_C0003G0089 [Parcubacteria group bacterium GW2011_GWA2_42_14]OGZ98971.1 MAG: hypothetical protein A3D41_05045 [Candidatus Sungbacteria bacterium RIFCSPHIGHO2_02_FULL_41_12b]OHA14478.1 MAG: hypothetical protein A3G49_06550 [Candidatus Sungbacteria bacterium RIFCSPLOWO2_12_FULL_41_11]
MIKEALKLEHIAIVIITGVTNGYYPHWKLNTGFRRNEISDISLQHIAQSVAKGITQGEVIEEIKNKETLTGWWKLKIQDE